MLPRLRAEESLLATQRGRVASGRLKAATANTIVRAWERTAAGAGEGTVKASPRQLAELGIGVMRQRPHG